MGYGSTLQYVAAAAAAVMRETGLLPHANAGALSADDAGEGRQSEVEQIGRELGSCQLHPLLAASSTTRGRRGPGSRRGPMATI